jgi:V8-like Glu-specific endopeptidase
MRVLFKLANPRGAAWWLILPAAGLALAAVLAPATAEAGQPASLRLSAGKIRSASGFWTPARMRRAHQISVSAPRVASRGRFLRAGVAARESPQRYPPRPAGSPALASSASESVSDPTLPGVRQNGAVFISEGQGRGFARCSGTSVNAPNLSLVFTAGHCVYDEGRWSARNWVFVPGYRYGERPFGTFVAHWLGTTPQWLREENFNYDVGVAVVSRNERGQRLAEAVGADGFASGLSPDQLFNVYGYPVARPFTGATLQLCPDAAYEGHDLQAFLTPGPLELGVQCNISGGSSGGGWVIAGGLLNGVTSNSYDNDPSTSYGPYFGKAIARLFDRAAKVK